MIKWLVISYGLGFCAGGILVSWLWQRDVDAVREVARDAVTEAKAQAAARALEQMYRPRAKVRDGFLEPIRARTDEEAWRHLMDT